MEKGGEREIRREREGREIDYCLKRFYVNTNEYDINRNGSNNEHA